MMRKKRSRNYQEFIAEQEDMMREDLQRMVE